MNVGKCLKGLVVMLALWCLVCIVPMAQAGKSGGSKGGSKGGYGGSKDDDCERPSGNGGYNGGGYGGSKEDCEEEEEEECYEPSKPSGSYGGHKGGKKNDPLKIAKFWIAYAKAIQKYAGCVVKINVRESSCEADFYCRDSKKKKCWKGELRNDKCSDKSWNGKTY